VHERLDVGFLRKSAMVAALTALVLAFGAGMSANAKTVTFDFNALSSGATSSAIQTYMDGVLGCKNCVTVTGAVADQKYNGDGHVTGPGKTKASTSLTLGTSDAATASNWNSTLNSGYDTFIANTNDQSQQISNEISLVFQGLKISSVSFDYEVFPDGTCSKLDKRDCGGNPNNQGIYPNQPDLEFWAGGKNVFTTYGVTPGTTNGNATHSPNSKSGTEYAPQYIGHWSGSISNVNELDFIDWPATIGIDNLQLTTASEPGIVPLLGLTLLGVGGAFRRRLGTRNDS